MVLEHPDGYAFTTLGEDTAQVYAETVTALDTAALAYLEDLTRRRRGPERRGHQRRRAGREEAAGRVAVRCRLPVRDTASTPDHPQAARGSADPVRGLR